MNVPEWYLDELAHAGAEHLDPDYVAGYDRKAGDVPVAVDIELLQGLGLGKESLVIDLGAGTGAFTLAVAPLCARVVAVDVSPAMTTLIQSRVEAAGLSNVEVVRRGLLRYLHAGHPADVAYSRNALHQLPDFWKAVALVHIARALRPGGVLRLRDLVFSFDPPDAAEALESWFAGAVVRPEHGYTRAELQTHVREEHSTFSWLLEPMLERAGFEIVDASYGRSRAYAAYTCIRRP